jgi:hypothetical protein
LALSSKDRVAIITLTQRYLSQQQLSSEDFETTLWYVLHEALKMHGASDEQVEQAMQEFDTWCQQIKTTRCQRARLLAKAGH